jgi:hypothetical protein
MAAASASHGTGLDLEGAGTTSANSASHRLGRTQTDEVLKPEGAGTTSANGANHRLGRPQTDEVLKPEGLAQPLPIVQATGWGEHKLTKS